MPLQNPLAPAAPEEAEEKIIPLSESIAGMKAKLAELKEKVSHKKTMARLQEFFGNYNDLTTEERKKEFGIILGSFALAYLLDKKKQKKNEAEPGQKRGEQEAGVAQKGAEEEVEEEPEEELEQEEEGGIALEEAREVVCTDMRLICINTHPAARRFPNPVLKEHPSFLNQYGLPTFRVWKREMISLIAPEAESEEEGVRKVTEILQWCPMGKYQCMPKFLFPHVKLPFLGEEGLKSMWEFLQTEDLQRKACLGYLMQLATQYDNDPELVAAGYYGGSKAADKLKKVQEGTADEEDKKYVEREQGRYQSIGSYAKRAAKGLPKRRRLDFGALLAQIAGQESGSLEGRISQARDEKWKEERYDNYWQAENVSAPETEVLSEAKPQKTHILKRRLGAPGWDYENSEKTTHEWDWEKAGNTKENIKKGVYCIEGVLDPTGFTRSTDQVPAKTARKLAQIARTLRTDPNMPLFTGITMEVDGIEVMMVKEIHMHQRGTASDYFCQPHTGVSYIVKKK